MYKGYIRWGAHRKWSEKRRKGTVEPIIAKGEHKPIITEELFDKAQIVRISRGGKSPHKYDCMNILTGILKCPECGAGMVLNRARTKKGIINYYGCGAFHNKGSCVCHSNLVPLEAVNEAVLSEISKLCNDEVIIKGVLKKLNKGNLDKIDGTEMTYEQVQRQLSKTSRDIKTLQERFEQDDSFDPQEYKIVLRTYGIRKVYLRSV